MNEIKKCLLCGLDNGFQAIMMTNDNYRMVCQRCGKYFMTEDLVRYGGDTGNKLKDYGYILSGLSRELCEIGAPTPTFMVKNIDALIKAYPVPDVDDVEAKSKKLLERIKDKTKYFGELVEISYNNDYPLAYAHNGEELTALINLLKESRLLEIKLHDTGGWHVTITASGWNIFNKLKKANKESQQGFVAAWFDPSMDESILAMEEAIKEAGFNPMCIRDEFFSERIMDKALGEIRNSRFAVIDLTGARNSVFFEAGFAWGLDMECIYVFRDDEDKDESGKVTSPLEFYVRHYQCYKYRDVIELKEIVKNAITARVKQ